MQAIWNDTVIADADKADLIYIERTWYFPPTSVKKEFLQESDTPYTCPWKGECQYFDIVVNGNESKDAAFTYPSPLPSALERTHKDFANYVAFWRDVEVTE